MEAKQAKAENMPHMFETLDTVLSDEVDSMVGSLVQPQPGLNTR